jgi:hypothetical protein
MVSRSETPKCGLSKKADKSRRLSAPTDLNGRYTAVLPKGVYKMSLAERGTVRASITVKATGANSRIDFDLRSSAEKQVRHYVWVGGETGTHLPRHWVEAGIRAAPSSTP